MFRRTRRRANRTLLCAALGLVFTFALAGAAHAATFTVNSLTDSNDNTQCTSGNTTCSLRGAINQTNSSSDAMNTINFASGLSGTYALQFGALDISRPVSINGPGANVLTVDGQGESSVFQVSASGGRTTISGLKITGGHGSFGGGVDALTPVSLNNDWLTHNTATEEGGAVAGGSENLLLFYYLFYCLVLHECTIQSSQLHAQPSTADVSLDGTTVSDNTVTGGSGTFPTGGGAGGGLAVLGNLDVRNSTLTGNSATDRGGNAGGAIASGFGSLALVNDTINGNSVQTPPPAAPVITANEDFGGAIAYISPSLIVFGQQQGAQPSGSPTIESENTIVTNNLVDGSLQNCSGIQSTVSDHNLSDDDTCGFTDSGSRQDPAANPQLAALNLNAPGSVPTEAIAPGSAALDKGDNTDCPNADERGVTRPQNGTCDIGAYEYVPQADLAIAKSGPASANVGQNVTYTITVTNNGPDQATGVTVNDSIPPGETLVSASASQGTCSGSVTCSLGTLASGAQATVTVIAKAVSSGSLSDTATVAGQQLDPNLANNTASATTIVSAITGAPATSVLRIRMAGLPACIRNGASLRINVAGAGIKQVKVYLNGKMIKKSNKAKFVLKIRNGAFHASNQLRIVAVNRSGRQATRRASVRRCHTVVLPRFTG